MFDEPDLIQRTHELAEFVAAAARRYGLSQDNVIAVGFSNGANIGASLLLLHPEALRRAVLFRAMVPLTPPTPPNLAGHDVFLAAGEQDSMVPPQNTEHLATMLRDAGAEVTLHWSPSGHELTRGDVAAAATWLSNNRAS